jgi:hypothetical protein
MTEYGWTWLSDYNWGWAPFHYGRWDYDNYYGWFWIPDNVWGPAWVIWRRAPGYYGWAPMGPGMDIGMNYGSYYNNYGNRWIFVNDRYFGRNNFSHYYANRNDYDRLLSNSTVINNTYVDNSRHITYISGPTQSDVRGVTGRRVSSYAIQENNVPEQSLSNGQLRIYRPQVMKNNDNERHSAPSVITNREDIKRASEINSQSQQGNRNTYNNTRQERQQNAVDRQNTVNSQNAAEQQDAVNQQKTVNRKNAEDRQNAVKRQNDVNQQNIRNNEKVLQQQNVTKTNNERREKSSNKVNTSGNVRSEESRKNSRQRK